MLPKRNLIRIVRGEQGVAIDPTRKAAGRGAYLHGCARMLGVKALKGPLASALRTTINEEDRKTLTAFMDSLADPQPEKVSGSAGADLTEGPMN